MTMTLPKINPTTTAAWKKLRNHFFEMQYVKIQELFEKDVKRVDDFHIEWKNFILDYSKNRMSRETVQLLLELAEEIDLLSGIKAMKTGKNINETEQRQAQHIALRDFSQKKSFVYDYEIRAARKKMEVFTEEVLSGKIVGDSGLPFTDFINIGIGGSDLGPKTVVEALTDYHQHLNIHFISNIDNDSIQHLLSTLDPHTTLVGVISKSFTTLETLENAKIVRKWLTDHQIDVSKQMIAVSSNIPEVVRFGISEKYIFPMWDFVGGRFSLWSAVGISIALAVGYTHFEALLRGAHAMDEHFFEAPFDQNIPVILALISIWYNNFFNFETEAIIPYSDRLVSFPTYLQQVIMESNGKNVDREKNPVNYQTGTIVWGEIGTNSQHAFFQLFHQGTKIIPVDFIGYMHPFHPSELHHHLMANFFAQTEAMMNGKKVSDSDDENAGYKTFRGNRPSNTLLIDQLTPYSLGSLIAVYEHKTFVQGLIWNIYSFDQFGVEYGKVLAKTILQDIHSETISAHDASTTFLLGKYKEVNSINK